MANVTVPARLRRHTPALAMLAPFAVLFAMFVLWPLAVSGYVSLTDDNGIGAPHFVGLANFRRLFGDARFAHALVNTAALVAGAVGATAVLALSIALAFRGRRLRDRVMRTVFFLPSVTSTIAAMLVWRWIFANEQTGLLNTVRGWFGLSAGAWLSSPHWTIPIMIVIWVWNTAGYQMVVFVAGLNAIPEVYYEAARLEGANGWQQFRRITLPLLRPVTAYVLVTGLITGFQTFELVYVLFNGISIGGVEDSGLLVVPYLYDMGFNKFELGFASAIAMTLFLIIFVVSMVQLRLLRAGEDR